MNPWSIRAACFTFALCMLALMLGMILGMLTGCGEPMPVEIDGGTDARPGILDDGGLCGRVGYPCCPPAECYSGERWECVEGECMETP